MEFANKTIVITGGASGIGAALVRRAAVLGARVCIADRDFEHCKALAEEVGGIAVSCDVSVEMDIVNLVRTAEEKLSSVDIFVSNAGLFQSQPDHAASASNDVWQLNWDVHVMAHVYAARALLPQMIARGSGYFVNVASAAGLLNQIGDAAYSATKHAAVSFAESLAISHGADGIGVSVVCPQYVATPLIGLTDADAETLQNVLTADEVAGAIVRGVSDGQFRILPHAVVHDYTLQRAQDHDRWIKGMQNLHAKTVRTFGRVRAEDFFKLV